MVDDKPAAPIVAMSGIIGGRALKGPADRMLTSLGHESSARGVASLYRDLATIFVLDETDAADIDAIAATGLRVVAMDTIMTDDDARTRVAAAVLDLARSPDAATAPPQAAR